MLSVLNTDTNAKNCMFFHFAISGLPTLCLLFPAVSTLTKRLSHISRQPGLSGMNSALKRPAG